MQLITDEQFDMLLENAPKAADPAFDPRPVVKLFTPDGGATWLTSAVDPDDPDILEGLCALGLGCVEFGAVRLSEIQDVRGALGLPVERDCVFRGGSADIGPTLCQPRDESRVADRLIATISTTHPLPA